MLLEKNFWGCNWNLLLFDFSGLKLLNRYFQLFNINLEWAYQGKTEAGQHVSSMHLYLIFFNIHLFCLDVYKEKTTHDQH